MGLLVLGLQKGNLSPVHTAKIIIINQERWTANL